MSCEFIIFNRGPVNKFVMFMFKKWWSWCTLCIFDFPISDVWDTTMSSSFLRALRLFFKILPICNTGGTLLHIFWPPFTFSTPNLEYYFYQLAYRDSKVPKHFVGLNQMQCSPSFDWNWGKQNDPTACWHQLHQRFQVLQQEKCLRYPPERVGVVTEIAIWWQIKYHCSGFQPIE